MSDDPNALDATRKRVDAAMWELQRAMLAFDAARPESTPAPPEPKSCPLCGGPAMSERHPVTSPGAVCCADPACPLYDTLMTPTQWDAIPRHVVVEGKEANLEELDGLRFWLAAPGRGRYSGATALGYAVATLKAVRAAKLVIHTTEEGDDDEKADTQFAELHPA